MVQQGMEGPRAIDIEEVLNNLEPLVDEAAEGNPFVILLKGKPWMVVSAIVQEPPMQEVSAEALPQAEIPSTES